MTRTGKRQSGTTRPGPFEFNSTRGPTAIHEQLTPVIFKGEGGYIVTGPESHQVYCFSSHDPEQMVDARDTEALLKTGHFVLNS